MEAKLFKSSSHRNLAIFNFFLFIFTLTSIIVVSITVIIYFVQKNSEMKLLLNREKSDVNLEKIIIDNELNVVVSDLFILAESFELQNFINTGQKKYLKEIKGEYRLFCLRKKSFDQIRMIDKKGNEIIRINMDGDIPVAVDYNKLQNKKHRYYFKETMQLRRNEIYISPFDLNVENNKIEFPLKPVIRFGTPVADNKGEKQGMVIVNYLGKIIIDRIKEIDRECFGNLMLLNSEGYWLKGENVDEEWGFMYSDKKDLSFSKRYPEGWKEVASSNAGQINLKENIYTFNTIKPLEELFKNNESEQDEYKWHIVSMIDKNKLNEVFWEIKKRLIIFDFFILIIIAIGSLLLARANIRHKEHELALIEKAKFKTAMEMAGAMSHELNQPLQIIFGYIQLLSNEVTDKNQVEKLSMMTKQLDRMIGITRKLLKITKYETKEYVDGTQIADIDKSSEDELKEITD